MKNRIRIIIIAAIATLLLTTIGALALSGGLPGMASPSPSDSPAVVLPAEEINTIPSFDQAEDIPACEEGLDDLTYTSTKGKIIEITPFYGTDGVTPVEGKYFVTIEDENGGPMNFVIDNDTLLPSGKELSLGSTITGYYKANQPMIMIYPPQIYAEVAVIDADPSESFYVGIFDENGISEDGVLQLQIDESVTITDRDGKTYTEPLTGELLTVRYGPSTRSIPAKATPYEIIVMIP